jgi:hypothetical protein
MSIAAAIWLEIVAANICLDNRTDFPAKEVASVIELTVYRNFLKISVHQMQKWPKGKNYVASDKIGILKEWVAEKQRRKSSGKNCEQKTSHTAPRWALLK